MGRRTVAVEAVERARRNIAENCALLASAARKPSKTSIGAVDIRADSAAPEAIIRSMTEAISTLGEFGILVNSAAIVPVWPIADIDVNDYQAVMDINVRAPVLFAKAVVPHLTEGGRIITIDSALGKRIPFPGTTASKAALTSLTRSRSRELVPNSITVNLVHPGATNTDANPADGDAADSSEA